MEKNLSVAEIFGTLVSIDDEWIIQLFHVLCNAKVRIRRCTAKETFFYVFLALRSIDQCHLAARGDTYRTAYNI